MPQDAETKKLEIKKYANRRYYDSMHSRHLTLEEIREFVRQGYGLRATDAKTGTDISAQVLAQIILELETGKLDLVPAPVLLWLIRVNHEAVKNFVEKPLKQALKPFFSYQEELHQAGEKHRLPTPTAVIAEWAKEVVSPFTAGPRSSVEKKETGPGPSSAAPGPNQDLSELISQVDKLKAEESKGRKKG